MRKIIFLLISAAVFLGCSSNNLKKQPLPNKKISQSYKEGYRYDEGGWIYIHIEGTPYDRGYQYGYLIAEEYKKTFECYSKMGYETMGMTMDFFIEEGVKMLKAKIPQELLDEMQGIADGISAKGYKTSLDEIIGWNSWIEISECWWPTVQSNFTSYVPKKSSQKEKCSAFIATGTATADGKIVISHSSFDNFWNVQWVNVILDVKPTEGFHFVMQTTPGYVASFSDFYISESGIVSLETALAGFNGFDVNKTPFYVRARNAIQYAKNIDEYVLILNNGNNGGNASTWLIGDINTNEIAQFQQGLVFQNLEKKKDGYFYGFNAAFDPRIRNLECNGEGYNDVRRHTGSRRVRLPQLLEKYFGEINIENAKKIMADHFDVYRKRSNRPAATTVCAHYDEDARYSMSSPEATHPDPYTPAGATDCKMTTADLAKNLTMIAIYGRPCARPFDAESFLKEHPQWNWQKGYLHSRPSKDWTLLKGIDE